MSERLTKKEKQFIEDIKRTRGLDFPRIGMQIQVAGDMGTIVGFNDSCNLDVVFTNQLKYGKRPSNCHPLWETVYFDADGNIVADYRKKAGDE